MIKYRIFSDAIKPSVYVWCFLLLGMFTQHATMEGNPRFLNPGDVSGAWCVQSFRWCSATSFHCFAVVKYTDLWALPEHDSYEWKHCMKKEGERISRGYVEQPSPHLCDLCQQFLLVITAGLSLCYCPHANWLLGLGPFWVNIPNPCFPCTLTRPALFTIILYHLFGFKAATRKFIVDLEDFCRLELIHAFFFYLATCILHFLFQRYWC